MRRDVLSVLMSVALVGAYTPIAFAASDSQLNFKVYSPESNSAAAPAQSDAQSNNQAAPDADTSTDSKQTTPDASAAETSKQATPEANLTAETSKQAGPEASAAADDNTQSAAPANTAEQKPAASAAPQASLQMETPTAAAPPSDKPAATNEQTNSAFDTTPAATGSASSADAAAQTQTGTTPAPAATTESSASTGAVPDTSASTGAVPETSTASDAGNQPAAESNGKPTKVLQGYVRVVPTGTKIPIIMDTAVDSDTSQEGDEFEARTSEDLTIDGQIAVPAGSVIKGRIAQLNAPKHLNRNGSVALKFDTVTTPDNRQIPLVANLVAHGGVVHARRGMKDIAIDCGTFALPTAAGLAIGAIAGNANKTSLGVGGGALIGAGVGAVVGVAVLLAKKGTRIDVRPGDELKIELAEDLRMPMM